jgi:hypothetical protein
MSGVVIPKVERVVVVVDGNFAEGGESSSWRQLFEASI